MTMHLAHPSLTMSGKRKGKVKFRNADEARKARELEMSWVELKKKWGVEEYERKRKKALAAPVWQPEQKFHRGQHDPKPQSLSTWTTGAVTIKQTQKYTGDKVMGVTIVHKSCLQPVFNQQEAIDAANMRR